MDPDMLTEWEVESIEAHACFFSIRSVLSALRVYSVFALLFLLEFSYVRFLL
jgi:hypothetical protein